MSPFHRGYHPASSNESAPEANGLGSVRIYGTSIEGITAIARGDARGAKPVRREVARVIETGRGETLSPDRRFD